MHHICNWCPWRPKELAGFNGTGVTVSCEPTYGCCGPVLGTGVLCQRGKCSSLLSQLSGPLIKSLPESFIQDRKLQTWAQWSPERSLQSQRSLGRKRCSLASTHSEADLLAGLPWQTSRFHRIFLCPGRKALETLLLSSTRDIIHFHFQGQSREKHKGKEGKRRISK